MKDKYAWLGICLNKLDVTNILREFDMTHIFKKYDEDMSVDVLSDKIPFNANIEQIEANTRTNPAKSKASMHVLSDDEVEM